MRLPSKTNSIFIIVFGFTITSLIFLRDNNLINRAFYNNSKFVEPLLRILSEYGDGQGSMGDYTIDNLDKRENACYKESVDIRAYVTETDFNVNESYLADD